ncbi:MAG: hypothetical protein DHS80DRAFT_23269 [Piptocephalis tieghemiana]|nr:MAG: hypothetical protein DHS80DRAFT_23269 [Piptocephalis tieghemiana]
MPRSPKRQVSKATRKTLSPISTAQRRSARLAKRSTPPSLTLTLEINALFPPKCSPTTTATTDSKVSTSPKPPFMEPDWSPRPKRKREHQPQLVQPKENDPQVSRQVKRFKSLSSKLTSFNANAALSLDKALPTPTPTPSPSSTPQPKNDPQNEDSCCNEASSKPNVSSSSTPQSENDPQNEDSCPKEPRNDPPDGDSCFSQASSKPSVSSSFSSQGLSKVRKSSFPYSRPGKEKSPALSLRNSRKHPNSPPPSQIYNPPPVVWAQPKKIPPLLLKTHTNARSKSKPSHEEAHTGQDSDEEDLLPRDPASLYLQGTTIVIQGFGYTSSRMIQRSVLQAGGSCKVLHVDTSRPKDKHITPKILQDSFPPEEHHIDPVFGPPMARRIYILPFSKPFLHSLIPVNVENPVLTELWLERCAQEKKMIDPSLSYLYTFPKVYTERKDLKGACICASGYDPFTKGHLEILAEHLGATFQDKLTQDATLLISLLPQGPKYARAVEWAVPVVRADWLEEVAKHGLAGKPIPYHPFLWHHPPNGTHCRYQGRTLAGPCKESMVPPSTKPPFPQMNTLPGNGMAQDDRSFLGKGTNDGGPLNNSSPALSSLQEDPPLVMEQENLQEQEEEEEEEEEERLVHPHSSAENEEYPHPGDFDQLIRSGQMITAPEYHRALTLWYWAKEWRARGVHYKKGDHIPRPPCKEGSGPGSYKEMEEDILRSASSDTPSTLLGGGDEVVDAFLEWMDRPENVAKRALRDQQKREQEEAKRIRESKRCKALHVYFNTPSQN